jgi:hypothetical protein
VAGRIEKYQWSHRDSNQGLKLNYYGTEKQQPIGYGNKTG